MVSIGIHLQNLGDGPLELYLRGRTIAFDIVIGDATGRVVWRRLEREMIPGIIQFKRLASGEVLELFDNWDQRTNRGNPIEPGAYTVRASFSPTAPSHSLQIPNRSWSFQTEPRSNPTWFPRFDLRV